MRTEKAVNRWTVRALAFAVLLFVIGFACDPPTCHADSLLGQLHLSVSGQGRWLYQDGAQQDKEFEGAGNASINVTPHVVLAGAAVYGFNDAYARYQASARIVSSDRASQSLSIYAGVGRYFSKHALNGLDEWAGEAGLDWRLFDGGPFTLGLHDAYGIDSGRNQPTVSLSIDFNLLSRFGGRY